MAYHLESDGMPFIDAVGVNCKMAPLLNIKVQVPSISAKGCMSESGACVIRLDYVI